MRIRKYSNYLILMFIINTIPLSLLSADKIYTNEIIIDYDNINTLSKNSKIKASENIDLIVKSFKLDNRYSLRKIKAHKDKYENEHIRMNQTYRGIPIIFQQIIIHESSKNGLLLSVDGYIIKDIESDLMDTEILKPKIKLEEVIKTLKTYSSKKIIRNLQELKISREDSELVIYYNDEDKKCKLAYYIEYFVEGDALIPSMPSFIIDANTGEIIKEWDGTNSYGYNFGATGPGGNTIIGTYEYGTDFPLLPVTKFDPATCQMSTIMYLGETYGVFNSNHTLNLPTTAYSFTCPRSDGISYHGAISPLNDTYYAIYSLYESSWSDPNILDEILTIDNINPLRVYVHYGTNWNGAQFNGNDIRIGDGDYNQYLPFSTFDSVSHEFGHMIIKAGSQLTNANPISYALNEAFADMTAVWKHYDIYGVSDWLISNDNRLSYPYYERSVESPHSDPTPGIENYNEYLPQMDPYVAGGMFRKAFYNLSTSPGWDIPKAYGVFYRANAAKWTPNVTVNEVACGVIASAQWLNEMNGQYFFVDPSYAYTAFANVGITCNGYANTPTLQATYYGNNTVDVYFCYNLSADQYKITRNDGRIDYMNGGGPGCRDYLQNVDSGRSYTYRVQAYKDGLWSGYSNKDIATSISYSDDPIMPNSTYINSQHINQLRIAIQYVRTLASLTTTWSEPIQPGTLIKGNYIIEMRNNINEALNIFNIPLPTYTDNIVPGTTQIKATHYRRLENA